MRDPTGRVPANDLDAEAAVLSAVMVAGAIDRVADRLTPADFYSTANARIYETCLELRLAGKPVDTVHVAGVLRSRSLLADMGGVAYLAQLCDCSPAVGNVESHAEIVVDKARVRRMVAECQRIAAEGYGDTGPVSQWINGCEAAIHALSQDRPLDTVVDMRTALQRVFLELQNPPETAAGVSTGLRDLDEILGRMSGGQLVITAALSSVGKSALAQNVAMHASESAKCTVLVFSAEMEHPELATRALFSDARVDSYKAQRDKIERITQSEWAALARSAERISKHCSIMIDDRPDITPMQIRAVSRRVQSRQGIPPLGLIVVDYVQLVNGRDGVAKNANREQEVSEIARQLKVLAKETKVPVMALAQLNSDADGSKGKGRKADMRKPRMSDLRESKAIAMHADKIILIHNPFALERAEAYRMGEKAAVSPDGEIVDLIVGKNRGGRTGTVQAKFWPHCTLFENA